jgi:hypothetical protein
VIAGFEQSEREESPDTVDVGSQEPVSKILKSRSGRRTKILKSRSGRRMKILKPRKR